MGYKLKIIMKDGSELIGPLIVPNSIDSIYGYEDRKIEREVKKCAKQISNQFDVENAECITV